ITHGQGVARGMAAITAASEALGQTLPGTTERIIAVLKKQELPTDIDGFDKDEILQGILVDKKNMAEMLNIILIDEIGKVYIHEINSGEVERYLK
ncbi:MAG: 3-dehydroquinate synthase, partial [Clostridia bacterium]|nr:3-dehydroquinate synthase [Clostridia bacterium]